MEVLAVIDELEATYAQAEAAAHAARTWLASGTVEDSGKTEHPIEKHVREAAEAVEELRASETSTDTMVSLFMQTATKLEDLKGVVRERGLVHDDDMRQVVQCYRQVGALFQEWEAMEVDTAGQDNNAAGNNMDEDDSDDEEVEVLAKPKEAAKFDPTKFALSDATKALLDTYMPGATPRSPEPVIRALPPVQDFAPVLASVPEVEPLGELEPAECLSVTQGQWDHLPSYIQSSLTMEELNQALEHVQTHMKDGFICKQQLSEVVGESKVFQSY